MELIETLKLYEKETRIIAINQSKIKEINRKNSMFKRISISFILIPILASILQFVINTSRDIYEPDIHGFFKYSFFVGIVIFAIMTFRANKRNKIINTLNEEWYDSLTKLKNLEVVPAKYHDHHAITEFIEYIDTLQAKTLEECITLYHTNMRHRERIEAMYDVQDSVADMHDDMRSMRNEMRDIERNSRY